MRVALSFGYLLLAGLVLAQDGPPLYDDQAKMIDDLVRRCVTAGALATKPDAKRGTSGLSVLDREKLRAALASDLPALNPTLRVGLIVRCYKADPIEAPALVSLLRAVAEVSKDGMTLGYTSLLEGDGARREGDPSSALKAYAEAARQFAAIGDASHQSQALQSAAVVRSSLEDFEGAMAELENALKIRRKAFGDRDPDSAFVLESIASNQIRRGNQPEAMVCLEKALEIRTQAEGPKGLGVGDTLAQIGRLQASLGEFARATESLQRALEIRQKIASGRDPKSLNFLEDLGRIQRDQQAYPQARAIFAQALKIREETQGPRSLAVADNLMEMGLIDRHLGEDRSALAVFGRVVKILGDRPGGRDRDLASALGNLGAVQSSLGDFGPALESLRQSLAIQRELLGERHSAVASTLVDIGEVHSRRNEPALALEQFERSLAILKSLRGTELSVINILGLIATTHRTRGDSRRAMESLEAALTVARTKGDAPTIARLLGDLANVDLDEGQPAAALGRLEESLAIRSRASGEESAEFGKTLVNLAATRHALGDDASALRDFERAASIQRRALGDSQPDLALTYNSLGKFHFDRGEYDRAALALKEALAIRLRSQGDRHPHVVATLRSLAAAQTAGGDHPAALLTTDRAIKALRYPDDLPQGGDVEGFKANAESVQVLLDRAAILQRLPDGLLPGQLREAVRSYQKAAMVLEGLRNRGIESDEGKLLTAEKSFDLFPRLVDLCGRLATIEKAPSWRLEAFAAYEQATARVFLETLGRSRAEVLGGVDREARDRATRLAQSIASTNRQIAQEQERPVGERRSPQIRVLFEDQKRLVAELTDLRSRLERENPRYHALIDPRPCSIEQARAALAVDEVALLYLLGREGSSLIVIRKESDPETLGFSIYRLPPAGVIADLVASLTDRKALEDTTRLRGLGAEAYRVLVAPAASAIAGKSLVVGAGGVLGSLPFELLVEPGEPGDRFLVEHHSIRYAPSMTVLSMIDLWEKARTPPPRPFWGLSDPTYEPSDPRLNTREGPTETSRRAVARLRGEVDGTGFARLPASGEEVARLATLLGAQPDEILVGANATESSVKEASRTDGLARHRWIHFACHGVLGVAEGIQPSLVLAQVGEKVRGSQEDGLLGLDEVSSLKLNADLVVLSACQTGRGKTYQAEGVEGLARAFLHAGSRGVICSLWNVDDASTPDFMVDFYTNLGAGLSAAQALRASQLKRIEAGEPPLHWAPFILIGR